MELSAEDPAGFDQLLEAWKVIRVVNMYFRALDEKHFDESHFGQVFAPDAQVVRPDGAAVVGVLSIADSHARSFDRFDATQHLLTGHDVEIDGGAASVRANLVAIHIWKDRPVDASMLERSFTAGGILTVALERTPEGWRIIRTENHVIWRTGDFGDMRQFSYSTPDPD